ncbi:MAG TPA: hypothetical protein VJS43_04530, partial [Candidatus Acidoferrales bacterium]|nr:hypothetical protein [Candidatus Acidoferrales bacterium]
MTPPRKLKPAAVAVILFCMGMIAAAQTISIHFDGVVFRVSGWHAPSQPPARGWSSLFRVYAGTGDVPPLAGSYAVENGTLIFHPAYPISAGAHYRAVFQPPSGTAVVARFDGPPRDKTPTT